MTNSTVVRDTEFLRAKFKALKYNKKPQGMTIIYYCKLFYLCFYLYFTLLYFYLYLYLTTLLLLSLYR